MYKIIGLKSNNINTSLIGGKAYNLIKISKFCHRVPHFIVIPAYFSVKAFKSLNIKSVEEIKEKIDKYKIDKKIINEVQLFFKKLKIKKVILRSSFAVEDSKKKSYAGIFSSYVLENVEDSRSLELQIKNIWKSIASERVLKYSKLKDDTFLKRGISVIIQQFIEPKLAGVALGVHNDFYSEIGFDSNDKVTSGKGYDINFYFYKEKKAVCPLICSSASRSTKIYLKLINNLNEFLTKAPKYLNCDKKLDVEFVYNNEKLYIVQVRPLISKIALLFKKKMPLFAPTTYIHHPSSIKHFYFELDLILHKIGIKKIRFKNRKGIYFLEINKIKDIYKLFARKIKRKGFLLNIMTHFIEKMFPVNIDKFREKISSLSDREIIDESIKIVSILEVYKFICELLDFFCNYNQNTESKISIIDCFEGKYREKFIYNIETIKKELKSMNYKELINFYFKFKTISDLLFGKEYMGSLLYELKNRMKLNFNITTIHFYNLPHSYEINTLKKHFITMQKLNEKGKRNNPSKENFVKVNKNKNSFFEGLIIVNKKFKGKAKIIKKTTRKEINNTEVMVTKTAHADYYIPGIIKSKAIITEFGNYTSHAAIVARELNKPCIVGVKGITSYCKDGDLIKFDGKRILVLKK
jgi:phosphohistidine swiveling domain-containing protein